MAAPVIGAGELWDEDIDMGTSLRSCHLYCLIEDRDGGQAGDTDIKSVFLS